QRQSYVGSQRRRPSITRQQMLPRATTPSLPITTRPKRRNTTQLRMLLRRTTLKPQSTTRLQVTTQRPQFITLRHTLLQVTTPSHPNTTQQRQRSTTQRLTLHQATTPRLLNIMLHPATPPVAGWSLLILATSRNTKPPATQHQSTLLLANPHQ
ncbi:Uncharacterized protein APZ42_012001, partial [Daphnia magna]